MMSLGGLCCLLVAITRVRSQISLVQSGAGFLRPSQSLQLVCAVSGGSIVDKDQVWAIQWVRQSPGTGLQWVGGIWHDGIARYFSFVQSRCTVTRDTAKNTVSLQLRDMKPEDSGMYYCVKEAARYKYYGGYFDYWGPGTTVTVTEVASKAPSLFPLISCGASQDPVAVGCLAKDFLPEPVDFSWTNKNNSSFTGGFRKYPSILSGGTYTTSSQVQVPLSSWDSQEPYYCKVTHSALGQPLVKKVVKQVNRISQPTVTLHSPILEDIANRNVTIVCMIRGFFPEPISVKWLMNGVKVTSGIRTEGPVANSVGDFDMTSWLDITVPDWNRNYRYSCIVDHTASNYWNTKNISKSLLCEASSSGQVTVDVFTIAPTFEEVFESKSAKLTCAVTNMMNDNSLNITWTRDDTKELQKTKTDVVLNDNGTYSAMGITTVCADEWAAGYRFVCRVSHEELATQKVVYLQKKNGMPTSQPVVSVYPPPSEELALKEYATILALVRGYTPCDIFVKWMRENEVIRKEDYVNTKPIEEVDPTTGLKTCLMYSSLKVNEREWSSGTVYKCIVGHEALPMQVTQKSIDKTAGKPTSISVSLVMSDSASTCH